ncbi:MAG: hypothetical protein MUF54_25770 [Polyangiaceae bacterium]|nr:hypothetical protein [Polyangiaceae bacterium]
MSRARVSFALVATALVALSSVLSKSASAQVSSARVPSPFAPDGPLAPWVGPLPTPAPPPQSIAPPSAFATSLRAPGATLDSAAPTAVLTAAPGSAAPPQRLSATMDRPSESSPEPDRRTYAVASFNPALTVVGKTSGRLELAPLSAHAVFGEASRLALYVDDVNRTVSGT